MDQQGVLHFDVPYPERLSRLLIFVKWLLIIPHVIVLYLLYFAFSITTFVSWFAILITGRYPGGLWDFAMMTLRWYANLGVYVGLMRDEYPPFSGNDGDYPVRFQMAYPERLSRGLIFVKWLLVIPHLIVLSILGIAYLAVWVVAWWAILITGNYPRGLFDFAVGFSRWSYRVMAY